MIVFRAPVTQYWPDRKVTFAACSSSGLPVTFTHQGPDCTGTFTGATATVPSPRSVCTIIAHQAGDPRYAPAPAVQHDWIVDFQKIRLQWSGTPGDVKLVAGESRTVTLTLLVSSENTMNDLVVNIGAVGGCGTTAQPRVTGTRSTSISIPVDVTSPGECAIDASAGSFSTVSDNPTTTITVTGAGG